MNHSYLSMPRETSGLRDRIGGNDSSRRDHLKHDFPAGRLL